MKQAMLAGVACLAMLIGSTFTAAAQNATSGSIDCSQANTMMMNAMHAGQTDMMNAKASALKMSSDDLYATLTRIQLKEMATITKIESKCGTNPKMKAAADQWSAVKIAQMMGMNYTP